MQWCSFHHHLHMWISNACLWRDLKFLEKPGRRRTERKTQSLEPWREKDEGGDRGNTMGWQHLLQSQRPLSPLLSHNPPLPVNTTEECCHMQWQVAPPWLIILPHVCEHTHTHTTSLERICASLQVQVTRVLRVFHSSPTWQGSLHECPWRNSHGVQNVSVGGCMSAFHLWHHLSATKRKTPKMTPASSLKLRTCRPWLPGIFSSQRQRQT